MKAAYVGIDFLYPALPALAEICEILKIFTCRTDNVTEFNTQVTAYARDHGVPLQTERVRLSDLEDLAAAGCELLLCSGYYYKLPILPGLPMVNIHPSLLPEGRGAWPMAVTILRGLTRSGVTLHKMAEGFDEGDILLQQAIAVDPEETHKSLTDKQRALLPGLVRDLCADLPGLWAAARPQGAGDYWPCPTERDWTIGPDTDLETADKVLRAFYTYELIYDDGADRWELIDGLLYDGPQPGMLAFPFRGKTICARRARRLST